MPAPVDAAGVVPVTETVAVAVAVAVVAVVFGAVTSAPAFSSGSTWKPARVWGPGMVVMVAGVTAVFSNANAVGRSVPAAVGAYRTVTEPDLGERREL
ncbi:hypothetical protein EDC01DRAFT_638357 [Geopyxis carbonaria]|nr:hypothetical protein EDC01DRAFT_638357 [Geopyxis carbonaria]